MTRKRAGVSSKKATKLITFSCCAPDAETVSLAGSFTEWDREPLPMKRDKNGRWTVKVHVEPGRHEYRFIADGNWFRDPDALDSVENPYGTCNSVIEV